MQETSLIKPDLNTLIGLFYTEPYKLGVFEPATAESLPLDYRLLLAHHHHMTVAVELYHHGYVDVRVLDVWKHRNSYARKILLTRQRDGQVVQFGIMRVNFAYLNNEVRKEIEGQTRPLGRILIEHNVLREIRLSALWKVSPGPDLQQMLGLETPQTTYGRTAIMDCNEEPAIELLEIVTPAEHA